MGTTPRSDGLRSSHRHPDVRGSCVGDMAADMAPSRGERHRAPTVIGVDSLRDARTGGRADLALRPLRRVGLQSEHGIMRLPPNFGSIAVERADDGRARSARSPRGAGRMHRRRHDAGPAPARCPDERPTTST